MSYPLSHTLDKQKEEEKRTIEIIFKVSRER